MANLAIRTQRSPYSSKMVITIIIIIIVITIIIVIAITIIIMIMTKIVESGSNNNIYKESDIHSRVI